MKKACERIARTLSQVVAYATIAFIILITIGLPIYIHFFWPD